MAAGHVDPTTGRRPSMCSGLRGSWLWLGLVLLDLTAVGYSASIRPYARPAITPYVTPSVRQSVTPSVRQSVTPSLTPTVVNSSDAFGTVTTAGYDHTRDEMLDQNYAVSNYDFLTVRVV